MGTCVKITRVWDVHRLIDMGRGGVVVGCGRWGAGGGDVDGPSRWHISLARWHISMAHLDGTSRWQGVCMFCSTSGRDGLNNPFDQPASLFNLASVGVLVDMTSRPSPVESWPPKCRAYLGRPNIALASPTGLVPKRPAAGACLRGASMAFGQFLMTAAECNPTESKSYGRNRGEIVSCRCRCSNTEHNCRWEECGVMGYGEGRDRTSVVLRPRP